ncbi:MAG: threonine/serine exporter family protein [Mycobacterium sp.]|nr:threonine/serine exporter family protein [Mycobacterium sp.]
MAVSSWITDRLRKPVPAALAPPDHYDPAEVAAMLRAVGVALIETSEPVQLVEQRLREIAARYTTAPVEVAVLPTMLLIQIGSQFHEMDASVQPSGRLDMAGRIDEIAALAEAGAIAPADAVSAIASARTAPRRFGAVLTTAGYAVTTVGFGLMIQPSWNAVLPHLFLGLVVGLIVAISGPIPSLAPILPTLSALTVTLLATWFVADVAHDGLLRVISPALIATLPGMALVIGAMELAGGRIVSGASRTVYAVAQLGLLVYGVVIGVRIAGDVPQQVPSAAMGGWSVYASIAVIAVGLYLYLSAPRGSLPWLLLTIAVAVLMQNLAGLVLNSAHSGFVAAVVAIPFALLASRIRSAPPAGVLALAAFWSLVPGQLTFMSLSRAPSGDYVGTASISVAAAAIASIALGTLVGWSLVRTAR